MHIVLLAHEANGPRMHHTFNAQPANGSGHVTVRLVLHAVTSSEVVLVDTSQSAGTSVITHEGRRRSDDDTPWLNAAYTLGTR